MMKIQKYPLNQPTLVVLKQQSSKQTLMERGSMKATSQNCSGGEGLRGSGNCWTSRKNKKKPHSVDCLEMMAARRAQVFAQEIGLQKCQFEETIIKALNGGDMSSSYFGHLIRDTLIVVNSFLDFSLLYCQARQYRGTCLSPESSFIFSFTSLDEECPI